MFSQLSLISQLKKQTEVIGLIRALVVIKAQDNFLSLYYLPPNFPSSNINSTSSDQSTTTMAEYAHLSTPDPEIAGDLKALSSVPQTS